MSKTLKHYRRKKFFYRLLLRNSPRAGAMFGLAWLLMTVTLCPLLILAALPFIHISYWGSIATAGTVVLVLYFFGVVVYAGGLSGILRRTVRIKWLRSLLAALGAIFSPFSGLVILAGAILGKRIVAMIFAVLGIAALAASKLTDPLLSLIVTPLYLAALAGMNDRRKLSRKFVYPLLIALIAVAAPFAYDLKLRREVAAERNAISRELGHSIEIDAFRAREARGLPITEEPLKSLIANMPDTPGNYDDLETTEAAKKALAKYRSKPENAAFIAALDRFSALPVNHVSHKIPENDSLYALELWDLNAFRRSAVYLGTLISAEPENKAQVRAANRTLIRLRGWSTHNSFVISHLVGIAIDLIRLKALSHVLESGKYTGSEFAELVGAPVDWERSMRVAFGNEATSFWDTIEYLKNTAGALYPRREFRIVHQHIPLFMDIMLLRDSLYAMRYLRRGCTAPPTGLSTAEKMKRLDIDVWEISRNCYILSGMFLPALGSLVIKNAKIADMRSMALIAAEVEEYRKQHGKLPESLDFIPKRPLSELNGRPFQLEKTAAGFRIVRDQDPEDTNDDQTAAYQVRLGGK